MRKIEAFGSVKDGKLNISYRSQFMSLLGTMEDCRVRIVVEKMYRKKSREQHGYYFAAIVSEYQRGVWEQHGESISKDKAHEELKANCLYEEIINEETGQIRRVVKSTEKLTTVEAEEYYERCRRFIFEWFGITCSLPNEQGEMELTV